MLNLSEQNAKTLTVINMHQIPRYCLFLSSDLRIKIIFTRNIKDMNNLKKYVWKKFSINVK